MIINHRLLLTFVERWYEETSNFSLSTDETKMTLNDVSCLLHLIIRGSSHGPRGENNQEKLDKKIIQHIQLIKKILGKLSLMILTNTSHMCLIK
jgi:hypothetical protein